MLRLGIVIGLVGVALALPAPATPDDDVLMHFDSYESPEENGRITTGGSMQVEDAAFWNAREGALIREAKAHKPITKPAKNVILFLGDGMSTRSVTLRRDLDAQEKGTNVLPLSFDKFPYIGWAWTYNVNSWVTDSASSANAYLCGVKAQSLTLGVTGKVRPGYCGDQQDPSTHNPSIVDWFQEDGRRTGLVTTATMTHATPAASYAHSAFRLWESDADKIKYARYGRDDNSKCPDLAQQLVRNTPGRDINVLIGGGRKKFNTGRNDGLDLVAEWSKNQADAGRTASVAINKAELLGVDTDSTTHLLGLVNEGYVPFYTERTADDVSLKDMTSVALKILQKDNDKGFFLLAEAGRVDHGHHFGSTKKAMGEMKDLDEAVAYAVANTNPEETLIVVTADHGHTLKMAGYPSRSESLYGPAGKGFDKAPYSMLNYATGPGAVNANWLERRQETDYDTNPNYLTFAALPKYYETHGGDDVPIFATGPRGYLLSGSRDNSYIAHAMAYAASVGPYKGK